MTEVAKVTGVRVSAYELEREIGRGGMGTVYRGRHVARSLPVAVKILQAGLPGNEREYLSAFRQEARAVGRLHHPNIVSVIDYGVLAPGVEQASGNALAAGQPYLVMEWLGEGTLSSPAQRPRSFTALVTLLGQLLDALAHAHARGVLHRDIKSPNIVVGADGRPRLLDFGIAQLDAPVSDDPQMSGTISSMAPEQINPARARDQGPWTDLYGVGCLVYELCAGRPPFQRDTVPATLYAHLEEPPPPLEPSFEVPPRFESWARCLLEKEPRARFRSAAAALAALADLDAVDPDESAERVTFHDAEAFGPTIASGLMPHVPTLSWVLAPWVRQTPPTAPDGPLGWSSPEVPASWAAFGEAPSPRPPTGLGLVGMRTIPMVDREEERDAVWSAFRAATLEPGVRVCVLRGAAGCGKTRIAQWMMERAVELGVADGMTAWHGPTESELSGLTGMMARHLGCVGLELHELSARVERLLLEVGATHAQAGALAEMLRPVAREEAERPSLLGGFTSEEERVAVFAEVLALLSRAHPLYVWLDDAQWGREALALVELLLSLEHPAPITLVLTAREEALAERAAEARTVARIVSHPQVSALEVAPLSEQDARQLVQAMLGLDSTVAEKVVARSRGNPLFAVQLVEDLVERGLLEVSEDGHFGLAASASGEVFALPDDLHEVWHRRTGSLLEQLRDADCGIHGAAPCECARDALEIAAVLGQEVATDTWRAVCIEAGVAFPEALAEALLTQELAVRVEGGWRFVHGLLRESLERHARERGVLPRHHRACARALSEAPPLPERLARIAEHALGASDPEWAADALFAAVHEAQRRGQDQSAMRYVARIELLLEQRETLRTERRRAELLYCQAERDRAAHPARAIAMLDETVARAREGNYELLLARALRGVYQHHARRVGGGRVADPIAEAVQLFERNGAYGEATACLYVASRDALERHSIEEANEMLDRMVHFAELGGDPLSHAQCLDRRSDLLRHAGETERALAASRDAVAQFEALGCLAWAANALNARAEILWLNKGDLDAAAATLRDSIERHAALGTHKLSYWARFNLAMVELVQGHYEVATPLVAWIDAQTGPFGYQLTRHVVHLMQAMLAASARDWERWDHHVGQAIATCDLSHSAAEEDAVLWGAAAAQVEAAGEAERARVARDRHEEVAQLIDKPPRTPL